MGMLYTLGDATEVVGGVNKGFATPCASPGVDPEESINYELGLRRHGEHWRLEALGFYVDYENLVGVCTISSGSGCDPGDAFNGEGVHIPGLELTAELILDGPAGWNFPLRLTGTWMDAEFQSNFDSEFFGNVSAGDPVPYVPEQQWWVSLGAQSDPFSIVLNASYADSVCTQASCDDLQRTGSLTVLDLSAHYRLSANWQVYGLVENLAGETGLVARQPYGARPNRPRSLLVGVRYGF
jgi:Fe(3+) dicitrate transport protein